MFLSDWQIVFSEITGYNLLQKLTVQHICFVIQKNVEFGRLFSYALNKNIIFSLMHVQKAMQITGATDTLSIEWGLSLYIY